ncbi:MAG: phage integrase N-terminal SAM-like domain-containing protein, partial [Desulfamplus sp.]|nr:phage integrase N-terminal SAM-like domain-containing protein [Desulfamplus sp.]
HYKKWLRYYWDFCHKYGHSVSESKSLDLFLGKLREKKQKDFQIKQASDAVSFYYEIIKPVTETNPASKQKPGNSESVRPDPPEIVRKRHSPVVAKPPCFADSTETVYIACTSPAMVPVHDNTSGYSAPRASRSDQKIVAEKAIESKSRPGPTGTSWKSAFDGLQAEIAVRHYSPKTLKSYKAWMVQFQAFTKSKPLETLSDSDMKDFLTFLAVKKNVSASTQNQALNAIVFLYKKVLDIPIEHPHRTSPLMSNLKLSVPKDTADLRWLCPRPK